MRAFSYQRASSLPDAAKLLASPSSVALGGGTDLLPSIEDGLVAPDRVVDLRGVAGSEALTWSAGGGLRIGASARINTLATDASVANRFAALAQACAAVGSPALRHMGTLGGNLCQRPRCWYLRRGVSCFKNGGSSCPAKDGENQHHAIVDGGPCHMVHASDPAVALLALDAEVEITGGSGARRVGVADFFVLPSQRMDQETVLGPGEFVSAVILPDAASGGKQFYKKLTQRGAWDFALASIAGVKRADGTVRLAMGGVSPRPWRVPESIEEDIASGGLDEDSMWALSERALYDARPLSKNGYKVDLAASLLRDAMRTLS
ncbi:MAG TPA: xanthine dehydrogenase family protein subunit M [Gemmatimonadaceae bacterium]